LADKGIDVEIVDLRCLNPLDMQTVLQSVGKTHRAVTVEECWLTGGWGGEVVARIMADGFDLLDAPVLRVAGEDVPMPYNRELEKSAIPDADRVVERVMELF
jgi:pyruvate dehydrogenase E1 component beta subunit